MAVIKNPLFTKYHTYTPPRPVRRGIQWSLDARRANIFYRRYQRVGQTDADVKIFGTFSPNTSEHSIITPTRKDLENKKDNLRFGEGADNSLTHQHITPNKGIVLMDYISIIDIDAEGYDKGTEEIILPFVPKELNYNPESAFVAIKPIGANNPRYQFTGAEDKLEFEIDWLSTNDNREDVIRNCRKIESLTKADGYKRSPHRVLLQWGAKDHLFAKHVFIIISAPYRMVQFSKGHYTAEGEFVETNMMPVQAYQRVTLVRVTSKNLSKIEIEYVEANS